MQDFFIDSVTKLYDICPLVPGVRSVALPCNHPALVYIIVVQHRFPGEEILIKFWQKEGRGLRRELGAGW